MAKDREVVCKYYECEGKCKKVEKELFVITARNVINMTLLRVENLQEKIYGARS